ncbi:MAG TPA: phospho-N-acetylmuramoyl-pentapeptide-transferase [Candidatus Limnocylindria bacterium]|nr:phospho-N-acetylmuramoyl-pentapeptide-transferase [Candidatus Limnocylindria bacterium]
MAILSLGLLLVTFVLSLVLSRPFIGLLRHFRIGKQIRREGPRSHYAKQGLLTMGGLLPISVMSTVWLVLFAALPDPEPRGDFVAQTIVPTGALVGVGLLGAIDDYVNVAYGFGIRGRHKLVWQLIVGIAGALYIQRHFGITGIYVPMYGEVEIGAGAFVALAVFVIIATSNAVNLTDGLDGLAGGLLVFAFLAFAFVSWYRGFEWLVVFCAAMVGALLAYLWFNVNPAVFMMGDVGSLAFGATLAAVALTTGFVLLIPVACPVFVAETVSVILQVGSYKIRKKRIFRMAPFHHHLEAIGWPEQQVTMRFWLIGALGAIVAAMLAFVTPL